jgi:hypothetical protein
MPEPTIVLHSGETDLFLYRFSKSLADKHLVTSYPGAGHLLFYIVIYFGHMRSIRACTIKVSIGYSDLQKYFGFLWHL